MVINNKEISVDEAMKISDFSNLLLKRRCNDMLLSDFQVSILTRNGIDYKNYNNFRELLFEIESYLEDDFDEELDIVGSQIAELIYYNESKK